MVLFMEWNGCCEWIDYWNCFFPMLVRWGVRQTQTQMSHCAYKNMHTLQRSWNVKGSQSPSADMKILVWFMFFQNTWFSFGSQFDSRECLWKWVSFSWKNKNDLSLMDFSLKRKKQKILNYPKPAKTKIHNDDFCRRFRFLPDN